MLANSSAAEPLAHRVFMQVSRAPSPAAVLHRMEHGEPRLQDDRSRRTYCHMQVEIKVGLATGDEDNEDEIEARSEDYGEESGRRGGSINGSEREVGRVDDGRGGCERWVRNARLLERSRRNIKKPEGRWVGLRFSVRVSWSGTQKRLLCAT